MGSAATYLSTYKKSMNRARPEPPSLEACHENQGKMCPPRSSSMIAKMIEAPRRNVPRKSTRPIAGGFDSSRRLIFSFTITRKPAIAMRGAWIMKSLVMSAQEEQNQESLSYHRHPIASVRNPPTGPPRLRPNVMAMLM